MSMIDSVMPLKRSAKLYGHKIAGAWQKSVEGIFEVGALLLQAKSDLAHGEFERMVEQHCPFGKRTAQQLMAIAANPVLSNAQHVAHLPASWGTLAELSRMEPAELGHALSNHWIRPEMTREDVGELRRRVRKALGHRVRTPAVQTKPRPFAAHLRSALDSELLDWLSGIDDPTADVIAERVARLLADLRREMADG